MKAGGVGITLTAASDVLLIEQDWTPANLDQAEDRAHRMGQKNAVNVTYLIAGGTLDDALYQLIESKRKISADLTKPVVSELIAKLQKPSEIIDLEKEKRVTGEFVKMDGETGMVWLRQRKAMVHVRATVPADGQVFPEKGAIVTLKSGKDGMVIELKGRGRTVQQEVA
jgi:hypothetical protein